MSSGNLTLDGAVVSTVDFVFSLHNQGRNCKKTYLVDEENTLTQVEFSILGSIDSFNLNEVLVGVLKNLRSTQ